MTWEDMMPRTISGQLLLAKQNRVSVEIILFHRITQDPAFWKRENSANEAKRVKLGINIKPHLPINNNQSCNKKIAQPPTLAQTSSPRAMMTRALRSRESMLPLASAIFQIKRVFKTCRRLVTAAPALLLRHRRLFLNPRIWKWGPKSDLNSKSSSQPRKDKSLPTWLRAKIGSKITIISSSLCLRHQRCMLSLLYQRRKRNNQPKLSATTSQSPALLPPNQAKTPDSCSSRRCKTSKVNRQLRGRGRRCNSSSRWTCLCTPISSLKYSTKPLQPRSTPVRNWDDLRRSSHAKRKRSQIAVR